MPILLIPARMTSTRLPGKPLADIAGAPMIAHVIRRAREADIGPVVVAADHHAILAVAEAEGVRGILTRPDHPSGSDRIAEALHIVDPERHHNVIINLQGDLPTIAPHALRAVANIEQADIMTLAAPITQAEERTDPNVVKAIATPLRPGRLRALYFTRAQAPWGEGPLLHHIGIYAYRRQALERFVSLPPSQLEQRERLEQLRALEAFMRVEIAVVDVVPLGVDVPEDLEKARAILNALGRK